MERSRKPHAFAAGAFVLLMACGGEEDSIRVERIVACDLLEGGGTVQILMTSSSDVNVPRIGDTRRLDVTVTSSTGGNAGYLQPTIESEGSWVFAIDPGDVPWALLSPRDADPLVADRIERPKRMRPRCGRDPVIRRYTLEREDYLIRLGPAPDRVVEVVALPEQ